jgi:hypothetical protein
MKKQIIAFILAFAFLFSQAAAVFADGMVIYRPDPYSDRWDYSDESSQQAFINYEKGLEKMIVSVKIDNNNNAVWLFPVPADPSKVVIDVVDELPRMNGKEVTSRAKISLAEAQDGLYNTQIYPAFRFFLGLGSRHYYNTAEKSGMLSSDLSMGAVQKAAEQDVVVYEHLDKEGLSSEIITAKTADGLYKYFEEKGLKIEKGNIPALDAYIGKDYSFVASWITANSTANYDATEGATNDDWIADPQIPDSYRSITPRPSSYYPYPAPRPNIKGISVFFPARDIYFPLLPTSVYESKIIPVTIRVTGFVDPRIYSSIASFAEVSYYSSASFYAGAANKDFFGPDANNQTKTFTKIEINAPSKYLTEDLWIKNRAPLKISYSSFIGDHKSITSLILLAVFSLLAAFIAGWLSFKGLRKNPKKLALLGFSNCLSIIGLIAATIFIKTGDPASGQAEDLLKQARDKGYVRKRRIALLLFIISPFSYFFSYIFWFLGEALFAPIVPLILIIIGLEIRRIKESDEPLMKQLKAAGYSTWTFVPRGGNRLLFVAFFSLLFLAITWAGTELLKLTV